MNSNIETALKGLSSGSLIILIDDLAKQTQVLLLAPAENISEHQVRTMVNAGRGVVCAALSEQRAKELRLPPMFSKKQASGVDFTVSVEARQGVSTGISAADRAMTLRTLGKSKDAKLDLVTPGHIFPLRAKSGGLLVRNGIAEAAVDLLTLAGQAPVAAICHCLNESGELIAEKDSVDLAERLELPRIKISSLINFRLRSESIVEKIASAELPTGFAGNFHAHCFLSRIDNAEHLALVKGDIKPGEAILVRVQAEHRFSDLLALHAASGRERIERALKKIEERGRGIFVYVRHPQKSAFVEEADAIANKSVSPSPGGELRENGIGAQILSALGVKRIELLTNSTREIPGIFAFNLEVVSRVPF